MPPMGLREYARHRGTALDIVRRAIAQGLVKIDSQGCIDSEETDRTWSGHIDDRWRPGTPLLDPVENLTMLDSSVPPMKPEEPSPAVPVLWSPSVPADPTRISEHEARRQKEVALARLRQMEVAEKEGRMIDAQMVRDRWASIAGRVREALLAFPDRCAPNIAGATGSDAGMVRAALLVEVETLLKTLHDDLRTAA